MFGIADNPPRPKPLDGVRVLDLSRLLPGPFATQHLADLGAEVIKIEDTIGGDPARPSVRELANRGKRSIAIDLKSADGCEVFHRLVETADVLVESFRPGTLDRLGLSYERLAATRPSLVWCSISGYGQSGPRRLEAGHDLNYAAIAGVLDQNGARGGPPVPVGFLAADVLADTLAATTGILAALLESRATGRGRQIDVGMSEVLLAGSILAMLELNESGTTSERGCGSHTGGTAQYNVYETKDGRHLAVAAQEKKFWQAFCETIDAPQLVAQHNARGSEALAAIRAVSEIIRSRSLDTWLQAFKGRDCCVTPVLSPREALSDEHARHRGLVRESQGRFTTGLPFKMSGLEVDHSAPAAEWGRHTAGLLGELGLPADRIAALIRSGAVRSHVSPSASALDTPSPR